MIYLSHYLSNNTPGYGNRKDVEITKNSDICCGDPSNSLYIKMSNHVGTHIDLPKHFDASGKAISDYPPSYWHFENIQVIEIPDVAPSQLIMHSHLPEEISENTEVLLLKTSFENYRGTEQYWNYGPGIHEDFARHLRLNFSNLKVIGFDFISLTSYQNRMHGRRAHRNLLSKEDIKSEPICIIEDMTLKDVSKNTKISKLIVSPLLIDGADGTHVTVFASIH